MTEHLLQGPDAVRFTIAVGVLAQQNIHAVVECNTFFLLMAVLEELLVLSALVDDGLVDASILFVPLEGATLKIDCKNDGISKVALNVLHRKIDELTGRSCALQAPVAVVVGKVDCVAVY